MCIGVMYMRLRVMHMCLGVMYMCLAVMYMCLGVMYMCLGDVYVSWGHVYVSWGYHFFLLSIVFRLYFRIVPTVWYLFFSFYDCYCYVNFKLPFKTLTLSLICNLYLTLISTFLSLISLRQWMNRDEICIGYSTIETKEVDRIGYNGFLFPHEYSGESRGA